MSVAGPSALPLVLVLFVGLVGWPRATAVVRRSPDGIARLDAGCDVVMAGAMVAG